jgi:hypothetical protein
MTTKQRKALWIGAALIAAYYFARPTVVSLMQSALSQQQRPKPTPFPPQARPDAPVTAVQGSADAPAISQADAMRFSGVWNGRTAIAERGICNVHIEVHGLDAGKLPAFLNVLCSPAFGLMSRQEATNSAATITNAMNPEAAVLSGTTIENGSLRFKVDKLVGEDSHGCAPDDFSLTPFGNGLLAAEWHEPTCKGGRVIMQRQK